jgi:hypothetical protein
VEKVVRAILAIGDNDVQADGHLLSPRGTQALNLGNPDRQGVLITADALDIQRQGPAALRFCHPRQQRIRGADHYRTLRDCSGRRVHILAIR